MRYFLKNWRLKHKKYAQDGRQFEIVALDALLKLRQGRVYTGVYVPLHNGGITEIDLVLINRTGIYVFECKSLYGYVNVDIKKPHWQVGTGKQAITIRNPYIQNTYHTQALAQALQLPKHTVYNCVLLPNKHHLKPPLYTIHDLKTCLSPKIAQSSPVFTKKQVRSIQQHLSRMTHWRLFKSWKHWWYRRAIKKKQS